MYFLVVNNDFIRKEDQDDNSCVEDDDSEEMEVDVNLDPVIAQAEACPYQT